jgi:protein-tyrosine phosphatase
MIKPDIYWINGLEDIRLGLMARPRSGDWLEDEIAGWGSAGVGAVVSLLEAHEVRELGLSQEARLCGERNMEFLSFPIPDRGTPHSRRDAAELVDGLVARLQNGTAATIHCRAGIGRTGLIAGCILSRLGMPFADIFATLSAARGVPMPDTQGQIDWVQAFNGGASNAYSAKI